MGGDWSRNGGGAEGGWLGDDKAGLGCLSQSGKGSAAAVRHSQNVGGEGDPTIRNVYCSSSFWDNGTIDNVVKWTPCPSTSRSKCRASAEISNGGHAAAGI